MNQKHTVPRSLFITDDYPPFTGGSVTMVYNLSLGLDLSNSAAFVQKPGGHTISSGFDDSISIDIKQESIAGVSSFLDRGSRFGIPSFTAMLQIPKIVKRATKLGKETNAQLVVTNWPGHTFVISAWLAAKRLKLPLVVYYHDLWVETRQRKPEFLMSRFLEKRILKYTKKLLVATPPTAAYIKEKHGIDCGVVEHALNSNIWPLDKPVIRIKNRPKKIVMLGGVNKFNNDSVAAFSKAIAKTDDVSFRILTRQSKSDLERLGLDVSKVECFFCPREKLKETILEADTLYLALGFDTPVPQEVEVVLPTRLMDYLATGIPILSHGPSNCWTLQEAHNRKWSYCITSLDIEEITSKLNNFLSLPNYDAQINAAWDEAKRRDFWNISKHYADYLHQAVEAE